MSLQLIIGTILDRNEAWLKEFDQYAQEQKAPLLYVDMQSPSVNKLFFDLAQKLDAEKRVFMRERLQQDVPEFLAEKEMLQTYRRIIQSESKPPPPPKPILSKYMCFKKNVIIIEPVNYIDRINRQLPYYE